MPIKPPSKMLAVLVDEWKAILGLRDWQINAVYVHHYQLAPKRIASITFNEAKKSATIVILDPREWDPDQVTEFDSDPELSLVHELVHIHLCYLETEGHYRIAEEQAVHALSRALVRLKRMANANPVETQSITEAPLGKLKKIKTRTKKG